MTININSLALPYVHVHCDRGHLVNAFVNPKVSTASERVSDNFKHRLIPLNIDGSVISIIDLGWKMTPEGHVIENDNRITSSDFMNRLASWKYIAICTTDGKLLSNRRSTKIPSVGETSLTEYRKKVGEFEVFEVELDPKSGYFSFKSHNDMYLQPNLTFSTTPCRPSKFLWKISPLLEDYKERVEFVGVCRHGEFVMKKTAVDGLIGEAYINPIVKVMYEKLQSGQSHCFHGELKEVGFHLWHYFLRGDQDELYMVVTTHKFSSAYATLFMGELPHLYDKYVADGKERDATIERLQKNGKEAVAMMNKELSNLTLYYDMKNEKYIPEELHELKFQLEQNISNLRCNVVAADDILEFSEDLVEQAEVFKKSAAGLKKEKNGVILAASIVGVAVLGATIVVATGGAAAPVAGVTACALGEVGATVAAAEVGTVAAAEVGTVAFGAVAAAAAAVGPVGEGVRDGPRLWKDYVSSVQHDWSSHTV